MKAEMSREKYANLIYAGAALIVMIGLGFSLSESVTFVVMRMMCMALMAVALNLQYGFGGMTNLGGGMISFYYICTCCDADCQLRYRLYLP